MDREQGGPNWSATLYNGGSHWHPGEAMLSRSYGLPQAQPPWKMASAGAAWQTDPLVQLRWMRGYVNGRYGGSCAAWGFWQAHWWY